MKRIIYIFLFICIALTAAAQQKLSLKGKVIDKGKREPVSFASVGIYGTGQGSVTDSLGNFTIKNITPGIYRLQVSAVGYNTVLTPEYILSTKDLFITVELEENVTRLNEVSVTASTFRRNLRESGGASSYRITGNREESRSQPRHFTHCAELCRCGILAGGIPK